MFAESNQLQRSTRKTLRPHDGDPLAPRLFGKARHLIKIGAPLGNPGTDCGDENASTQATPFAEALEHSKLANELCPAGVVTGATDVEDA